VTTLVTGERCKHGMLWKDCKNPLCTRELRQKQQGNRVFEPVPVSGVPIPGNGKLKHPGRNTAATGKRLCSLCGHPKTNAWRSRVSHEIVCKACYQRARYSNILTHKPCSECTRVRQMVAHNEFGDAICQRCYQKKQRANAKMAAHPAGSP